MGSGSGAFRALFGAIVFLGLIWCLFAKTAKAVSPSRNSNDRNYVAEERHLLYQNPDLHYVSKRRVPNGPDPIHNRRAQKSRQPPRT